MSTRPVRFPARIDFVNGASMDTGQMMVFRLSGSLPGAGKDQREYTTVHLWHNYTEGQRDDAINLARLEIAFRLGLHRSDKR